MIEQPDADPFAVEETITQFESFLREKGVAPADRLGCLVSITSTAGRDPDLARDEGGPIPAQDIFPDEEPTVESVPEMPRTDKRFKNESSRTQVFENTQDVLRSRVITYQRLDEMLPGFYISWGTVAWSRGSIMSGTTSRDVLYHQSLKLMECVSSAPRKVRCTSTSPAQGET